jgi:hypothetical protein
MKERKISKLKISSIVTILCISFEERKSRGNLMNKIISACEG